MKVYKTEFYKGCNLWVIMGHCVMRDKQVALIGDKQDVHIEGQTGCLYWGQTG